MRGLIIVALLLFSLSSGAQNRIADLSSIVKIEKSVPQSEKKSFFRGLLSIYDRHVSEQIINDCIYEHSCSNFSQGAFRTYGLIKGYFLTFDRLTRCNRASSIQIAPVRINQNGKIRDHWSSYTLH